MFKSNMYNTDLNKFLFISLLTFVLVCEAKLHFALVWRGEKPKIERTYECPIFWQLIAISDFLDVRQHLRISLILSSARTNGHYINYHRLIISHLLRLIPCDFVSAAVTPHPQNTGFNY